MVQCNLIHRSKTMTAEQVKDYIDRFHADTSRSLEETLDGLEEIAGHVDMLADAVRSDLKSQE